MKHYISIMLIGLVSLVSCSEKAGGIYSFIEKFDKGKITPGREKSTPTGKPVLIFKGFEVVWLE